MANPRSFLAVLYVFLVFAIATPSAVNASVSAKSNNSGVQADSKCHNMYTYNSFYAGANKKIEALLREIKNELSEMREEIKSLKGNETVGKGMKGLLDFLKRHIIVKKKSQLLNVVIQIIAGGTFTNIQH